jgi:hypothetical protein
VDDPEARRGQRAEHGRVLGDSVGDALAAAQAGADQVVGVLAVAVGAWRADGLAAVAARLAQNPVGLAAGRPDAPVAAVAVARLDVAPQPHGPGAIARRAQLRLEAIEGRPRRARDQLAGEFGSERDHAASRPLSWARSRASSASSARTRSR